MAEKAERKPESKEPAGDAGKKEAAKGGGLAKSTPVMLGAVMLVEAIVLFAGFKFVGGGANNANANLATQEAVSGKGGHGEESGGAAKVDRKKLVEVPVVDMKAPNRKTGRHYVYDVVLFVLVKAEHDEKVKGTIKEREATIKNMVRTIVAQLDTEKLGGGSEPGLETFRRQVKYQLDEIVGEGLIEDVLVTRCIQFAGS